MFYSRSSLSRKGPLGAIWVAAYCLKRLRKAQVFETHIPSSVDEILQNEMDAVTYRVLAYLLLGLVRIYSKKVEYLFDDCQDTMIKIKDFMVGEKSNSQLESRSLPCYTITVPDRFELDSFDLGILEDVSGDNVVPLEEITLKDCASKAGRIGLDSLGKYHFEGVSVGHDIGCTDYLPTEDFSSHFMENEMNMGTSLDFSSIEASLEKLLSTSFFQEANRNLDRFCGAADPIKPFGEDHKMDGEHIKVPAISETENEAQGKATTEMVQDDRFHGVGEKIPDLVNLRSENHQSDAEQMKVPSLVQLENEMCKHINEDNNLSELENEMQGKASTEMLQDDRFHGIGEETVDLVNLQGEDHQKDGEQLKIPSLEQLENEMCLDINEDNNLSNLENEVQCKASTEMLQDDRFHRFGKENLVDLHGKDHQSDGEPMKVSSLERFENEMCHNINEDSDLSNLENEVQCKASTEMLQDDRLHGFRQENLVLVNLHGEDHESDEEQMKVPSLAQLENEICQHTVKDNELSNLEASMEKLLDCRFPQEVCMDVGILGSSEEEPPELVRQSAEGHYPDEEQMNSVEVSLSGKDKCLLKTGDNQLSVTLDMTPQSNFPDASGRNSPGFMVVHTPTTTEPARILVKRKYRNDEVTVFPNDPTTTEPARILVKRKYCNDDVTVFPNDVMRRCIEDASDLVSKRRKVPYTSLAAWRAFGMPNLSHGFFVPLLPYISSELKSLFCQERLKIPETSETLEPESPMACRLVEQVAIALKTPTEGSLKQMATDPETPSGKFSEQTSIALETPIGKSSEQIGIAPETLSGRSSEQMGIAPEAPETPSSRSSELMGTAPETPIGTSSELMGIAPETPIGKSSEQIGIAPETLSGRSSDQMGITTEAPETSSGRSSELMGTAPETPIGTSSELMGIAPEAPTCRSSEQMDLASKTPTDRSSEKKAIAPETPTDRCSEQKAIAPETPIGRSSEQIAIAPETPSDKSSEQMVFAPETPIFDSTATGPVEAPGSHKTSHSETVGPPHSFKIVKKEPSRIKDQEFDLILINEETNSFEEDNREPYGLSERTRMVARYLHRRFLYRRNRGENEAVNLMQVLDGKTKKESARLFYEMLVLKTKGFVDVRQDEAYCDILVQKILQWDQICGAFCL